MVKDLGAVSAYAYAVEQGYMGTEEEFAAEQANFAKNAQQVANDKATVEQTKNNINTTINNFDTHATEAVSTITTTRDQSVSAVNSAKTTSVEEVNTAKTSAISAVGSKGTEQVGAVTAEGNTQVGLVKQEGTTQKQAIDDAVNGIVADRAQIEQNKNDILYVNKSIATDIEPISVENYYINANGGINVSASWKSYIYDAEKILKILYAKLGSNAEYLYAISFYNSDVISQETFISGYNGIVGVKEFFNLSLPMGCKRVVLSNRVPTLQEAEKNFVLKSLIGYLDEFIENPYQMYQRLNTEIDISISFDNGYAENIFPLLKEANSAIFIDFETTSEVYANQTLYYGSGAKDATVIFLQNLNIYTKVKNGTVTSLGKIKPNTKYRVGLRMDGTAIFENIVTKAPVGDVLDDIAIFGVRRRNTKSNPFLGKFYQIFTVYDASGELFQNIYNNEVPQSPSHWFTPISFKSNKWNDLIQKEVSMNTISAVIEKKKISEVVESVDYLKENIPKDSNYITRINGIYSSDLTYKYYGEKIFLPSGDFKIGENLGTGQAGCFYKDYAFRGHDSGLITLYKYTEEIPQLVQQISIDKINNDFPHMNVMFIGKDKFLPEDEFPILYVNAYNAPKLPWGTLYGYRIKKVQGNYVSELIQTISIGFINDQNLWATSGDTRPYGNFSYDIYTNKLYAYVPISTKNITRMFVFNMPSIQVNNVILNEVDIIKKYDFDFIGYPQDNFSICGKTFIQTQIGDDYHGTIFVTDDAKEKIVNEIPINEWGVTGEPEMLDIKNGKIYNQSVSKMLIFTP